MAELARVDEGWFYVILTADENSYSVENNTSNVTVNIIIQTSSYISSSYSKSYSISANGQTSSGSDYISVSGGNLLAASATFNVGHNSDGTGTLSASCYQYLNLNSGTYGYKESASLSGSMSLTTIPRASDIYITKNTKGTSESNRIDLGQQLSITTEKKNSTFVNDLYYRWESSTRTAIAGNVSSPYLWTVPVSFANSIPNTTTGVAAAICSTGTAGDASFVGVKECYFFIHVPDTYVPTIDSVAITDSNNYLTTYGGYIKGRSSLTIVTTAAGVLSSTISSCALSFGTKTYSGLSISGIVPDTAGSISVSSVVTDSRGRTATNTQTITVLDWSAPSLTNVICERCDSDGTDNPDGSYAKLSWDSSISSLNSHNVKTCQVATKLSTATDYGTATTQTSPYIFAANGDNAYDIKLTVSDNFATVTATTSINTTFSLIDYLADGTGVAFGKAASLSNTLDCGLTPKFDPPIPVSSGGTGASAKKGARKNLGIDSIGGTNLWAGGTITSTNTGSTYVYGAAPSGYIPVQEGDTVTISLFVGNFKSTDNSSGYAYMHAYNSSNTQVGSDDVAQSCTNGGLSSTYTVPSGVAYVKAFIAIKGGTSGTVFRGKVERYEVSTDWSPSFSDLVNWSGLPFDGVWMGSIVVTLNSNGNARFMSNADVVAKMGRSFDAGKDVVVIMNGDNNVGDTCATAGHWGSDNGLWVHSYPLVSSSFRVNYLLLRAK